jgi:hypothetical protein
MKNCHLALAIFVDVDGTLAGPYRQGTRQLRSSAYEVIAMLAEVAPVFLWSIAGAENGTRLLDEFPELRRHVAGSHTKSESLLKTVERAFAIDDESLDLAVLRCRHFILASSYFGGDDDGDLRRVASELAERTGEPSNPPLQRTALRAAAERQYR